MNTTYDLREDTDKPELQLGEGVDITPQQAPIGPTPDTGQLSEPVRIPTVPDPDLQELARRLTGGW